MSVAPREKAAGHCRRCSTYVVRGVLVKHVDQGSGPGFAVVECDSCAAEPPPERPAAEQPRTYSL